jgi:hypothetical protein
MWCQPEKRGPSHDAASARRATGNGEADASRAKRPGCSPGSKPAKLDPLRLVEAVVRGQPEDVEALLATGAEVGERQRPDLA